MRLTCDGTGAWSTTAAPGWRPYLDGDMNQLRALALARGDIDLARVLAEQLELPCVAAANCAVAETP